MQRRRNARRPAPHVIKAATFEGGGASWAEVRAHHVAMARVPCVDMTTLAYIAVSECGKSFPRQRTADVRELRSIADAVHAQGGVQLSVQLTHGGYFAGHLGPSRLFNPATMSFCKAMDADDLDRIERAFAEAAAACREAGCDAVEVHLGHGYLLSQFLSPYCNPGKALEARLAYPMRVVRAVRRAIGGDMLLLVKMNMRDGFRGGLELKEGISCIERVGAMEEVDLVVLSGGFVTHSGFFMLRGPVPLMSMAWEATSWLQKLGLCCFGPCLVPELEYADLFFLNDAKEVQTSVTDECVKRKLVYIGGVATAKQAEELIEHHGFAAVQVARALLAHATAVASGGAQSQSWTEPRCTHCNECVARLMNDETGKLECTGLTVNNY